MNAKAPKSEDLPARPRRGIVAAIRCGGLHASNGCGWDPGSVGRVRDVEPTRGRLAPRRWISRRSRTAEGRQGQMPESRSRGLARQSVADADNPQRHDRLHANQGLGAALEAHPRFGVARRRKANPQDSPASGRIRWPRFWEISSLGVGFPGAERGDHRARTPCRPQASPLHTRATPH